MWQCSTKKYELFFMNIDGCNGLGWYDTNESNVEINIANGLPGEKNYSCKI